MDAADVDNNDDVSVLLDALSLLEWQFLGSDPPADSDPEDCGPDPDGDTDVECEESPEICP